MFAPHALLSRVALVRSPDAQVPPEIALPVDIHPLPESIDEYFSYPFSAEEYVLSALSSKQVRCMLEQKREQLTTLRALRQGTRNDHTKESASSWDQEENTILKPIEPHREETDGKGKVRETKEPASDQMIQLTDKLVDLNTH